MSSKPSEQIVAEAREAYELRFGYKLPWESYDHRSIFIISSLLEYIDNLSERVRLLEHGASRGGDNT